jgi:hypothetical protein
MYIIVLVKPLTSSRTIREPRQSCRLLHLPLQVECRGRDRSPWQWERPCGIVLQVSICSHVQRERTVNTLAILDFDLAKVFNAHGSLDGKVSQRVVVLSLACGSAYIVQLTEIPFFCPSMTRSRAASSLSPCRLSSLLVSPLQRYSLTYMASLLSFTRTSCLTPSSSKTANPSESIFLT